MQIFQTHFLYFECIMYIVNQIHTYICTLVQMFNYTNYNLLNKPPWYSELWEEQGWATGPTCKLGTFFSMPQILKYIYDKHCTPNQSVSNQCFALKAVKIKVNKSHMLTKFRLIFVQNTWIEDIRHLSFYFHQKKFWTEKVKKL